MPNIISIVVETGTEKCMVDANALHEALLQLPAEKYIALYGMMQKRMNGAATELHGIKLC